MTSPPGWDAPPPPPPPPPPGGSRGGGQLRPLNLGDVLDGMFRLLMRHWRAYLVAMAAVIVPTQLVFAYFQRGLASDVGILDIVSDPMAAQTAATGPAVADLGMSMLAGMASGLLVSPLVAGVAALLGARAHLGQEVSAGGALRAGLRRYLSLVTANLLHMIAVTVAVGLFMGPVIAGVLLAGDTPLIAVLALPVAFLLALACVLTVYTLLLLTPATIMVEERGPISGLARSAALVRARFWAVLGIGLLAWIISGIIGTVLASPFALPASLFGGMAFFTLTTVGSIVAGVVTAPLMPNAIALLYLDLRVRREGLDLEAMASAVEQDGEGSGPA